MKIIVAASIAVLSLGATSTPKPEPAQAAAEKPIKVAIMCFKTGEDAPPNSMTKICYYDCLGSPVAITISSVKLCPLSINR